MKNKENVLIGYINSEKYDKKAEKLEQRNVSEIVGRIAKKGET